MYIHGRQKGEELDKVCTWKPLQRSANRSLHLEIVETIIIYRAYVGIG